ncbi:MAG: exopolyphosphatase [Deltaproteobacteria bacterium]|nr:exopolyphosphatase [Deltaproteobacteria bacterium]
MSTQKYRLVTRSDLDGLVSAVLLHHLGMIDEMKFVHPKDMQDGTVEITQRDITTNLPYVPGAHLVFDHHESEVQRAGDEHANFILDPAAPSASRVVYNHYGADAFQGVNPDMMAGVDKADSAQFTPDEVRNPAGWTLLHFLTDARTGLGRFHHFRISNYTLMTELAKCIGSQSIETTLAMPDVKERVDLYCESAPKAAEQIRRCATVSGNVVVLDLRGEDEIWPVNRFMVYALFPQVAVSLHLMWGRQKQNVVIAAGKSIFNRSSKANLGQLLLEFGGGGHAAAATCQLESANFDAALKEIVTRITAAG